MTQTWLSKSPFGEVSLFRSLPVFRCLIIEVIRTLMADLSVQRLFLWISFLVTREKLALGRLELQAACEPNLDLLLFKHNDQHSI